MHKPIIPRIPATIIQSIKLSITQNLVKYKPTVTMSTITSTSTNKFFKNKFIGLFSIFLDKYTTK